MTRYRVTAPVVVCKTMTHDGLRWLDLPEGATVPEDAGEDWITGHLQVRMIAAIPGTEPQPERAPEPAPARVRGASKPAPTAGGE